MEHNAILAEGQTYRNRNGSDYLCRQTLPYGDGTILERATDGWTLNAHGITLYDDGTIEWDYSTGGRWPHTKGADMNKYICEKCGAASYSAATPDTLRDHICLVKGCGGTVRLAEEGTAKQAPLSAEHPWKDPGITAVGDQYREDRDSQLTGPACRSHR